MKFVKILCFLLCTVLLFTACSKKKNYYESGVIESEIQYRFGKEQGTSTYYFETPNIPKIVVAMKKGKKEGAFIRYFANGSVDTKAFYQNDLLEGTEIIYDVYGCKIKETTYHQGIKQGIYTSYHSNGEIREQGFFDHDLFDGQWSYYDERGCLVGEGTFDKGTGELRSYDAKGNLTRISHYANNLKNGDEIYYLPNGDVGKVIVFKDDRIDTIDERIPSTPQE